MYYTTEYLSPVGRITLASDGEALTGLWIEKQKYFEATLTGDVEVRDGLTAFDRTKDWLERYFAGKKPAIFELKLAPSGSPFRQGVWEILCQIPYGQVITYGDIAIKMAAKMGRDRMSGQAVGGAVSHNPISIIIPCHRVVGADGSLTGYAGGISTKVKLLELEGVDLSRLFLPKKGTAL